MWECFMGKEGGKGLRVGTREGGYVGGRVGGIKERSKGPGEVRTIAQDRSRTAGGRVRVRVRPGAAGCGARRVVGNRAPAAAVGALQVMAPAGE